MLLSNYHNKNESAENPHLNMGFWLTVAAYLSDSGSVLSCFFKSNFVKFLRNLLDP